MGNLDRVRWHCRRGLLELDLVLARFADRHLERLTEPELRVFEELLEYADNDLLDMVMGRAEPEDKPVRAMLERLRAA